MEERELRRYLSDIHVGDEVEIVYKEIGGLGFSDGKREKCKGHILMIDNVDIYLSLRDPIGAEERKFNRRIGHDSILFYKVLRRVDDLSCLP